MCRTVPLHARRQLGDLGDRHIDIAGAQTKDTPLARAKLHNMTQRRTLCVEALLCSDVCPLLSTPTRSTHCSYWYCDLCPLSNVSISVPPPFAHTHLNTDCTTARCTPPLSSTTTPSHTDTLCCPLSLASGEPAAAKPHSTHHCTSRDSRSHVYSQVKHCVLLSTQSSPAHCNRTHPLTATVT